MSNGSGSTAVRRCCVCRWSTARTISSAARIWFCWVQQIVRAAGASFELVHVPEEHLPVELALTGAHAQHLLASVSRAERLLDWAPSDPGQRVVDSVRWHLAHPPQHPWTTEDARADDEALQHA